MHNQPREPQPYEDCQERDSRIWVNFTRNGLRLGSRHQEHHTQTRRGIWLQLSSEASYLPLCFLKTNVTAPVYQEILEHFMLPSADQLFIIICHIHNYIEYNQQWNLFSAFNPSKCSHLEQWPADTAAPGEQLGVRCLAQGSHLSLGQFLPEPRFEPTTSGYKSDILSIRAPTAPAF